ncbi:MAG: hypothetical protein HQK59_04840 [Deltaproteobacteria bacterium]|nr:hypothetical protein [Deltaproteobacteria bacterium]
MLVTCRWLLIQDNRQQATSNMQQATSNMQRATSNMQRATRNMQRATRNKQPATGALRSGNYSRAKCESLVDKV